MKAIHKKRKKKVSKKTNRARAESVIISESESGPDNTDKNKILKNRQPVSKSVHDKATENRNKISAYFNIAIQFLKDSKIELKKVKWPTRKELMASTAMVILLVIVIAFFLGLIDFGLIKIIKQIVG